MCSNVDMKVGPNLKHELDRATHEVKPKQEKKVMVFQIFSHCVT